MNFYDAVSNSYGKNIQATKYVCFGIQMKSLAQKYCLDYDQISYWLREGKNYLEAIEREVFVRSFSKNMGGRTNYLWNIYQNNFKNGKLLQEEVEPEEWMCFINSYAKFLRIQKDFVYYQFLNRLEISFYCSLNLDERVYHVLQKYTPSFSLTELYYILDFENGFMKDFSYLEHKQVWVYNGNKEVLPLLKKSSR